VNLLLDTCAFLWDAGDRKKLSRKAARRISRAADDGRLLLSVISCWEVAKLVQKDRLRLALPIQDWLDRALSRESLELIDLTPEIAVESTELPGCFEGDPADQIIVATARTMDLTVVTADSRILDYDGVRSVW
jgi:PIN domain nuclease of toxin-antitoxin system